MKFNSISGSWFLTGAKYGCCLMIAAVALVGRGTAAGTAGATTLSLEAALERSRQAFQIKPDMRFVRAAEFIAQRLAGEPTTATVTLAPVDGVWDVSFGKTGLGRIKPFGTFEDNLKFVQGVAGKMITPRPGGVLAHKKEIDAGLSLFLFDDITTAVRMVDQAWNDKQSPLPLDEAARAALTLFYQSADRAGIADEIPSRAIAFFAADTALTSTTMDADKAMLAHCLGYMDDAILLTGQLRDDQPEKMFIFNHKDDLYKLGAKSDSTTETWFTAAGFAAGHGDKEQVEKLMSLRKELFQGSHIVSAIPLMLRLADWHEGAAMAIKSACYLALSLDGRTLKDPENAFENGETPFSVFEHGVSRLKESDRGPLLDQQFLKTYYQMVFTNAVEQCMDFYLNMYGSIETAQQAGKFFGRAQNGPVGEYSKVLDARLNETGVDQASRDRLRHLLENLHYVGAKMSDIVYLKVMPGLDDMSADSIHAGMNQLKRLDGRPDDYSMISRTASANSFRNPDLVEKVRVASTLPNCENNVDSQVELAYFRGDIGELIHRLAKPEVYDWLRATYFGNYLVNDPRFTSADLNQKISQLYERNPTNRTITTQYVIFLEKQKRYDEAVALQHKYAESQKSASGLEYPYARCREAELCAETGNIKKALAITKTVASSYIGRALDNMAYYNAMLGNFDEAFDWAAKARERYGEYGDSLGVSAYCQWLKGDYAKAADMIANFKYPLADQTNVLAKNFYEAMKDKSPDEQEKAISALETVGLGKYFGAMGAYFRTINRFDIEFEFQHHARESGVQEFRPVMVSYEALSRAKNTTTALEWLKTQTPPEIRAALGSTAFRESTYELLDTLIPYDDVTTTGQYNWTLRAAAVCASTTAALSMGDRVMKHFASGHSTDFHFIAGRFLLGMDNQEQLQSAIRTTSDLCQAACYLAFKARAAGDYRMAADWFQVCILSGEEQLNEYQKARLILSYWAWMDKSLDYIPTLEAQKDWAYLGS